MGNNLSPEERAQELSTAAEEGHAAKVRKLIENGADPNRKIADGDRSSRTSLHRAAKTKNNVDVLTKLLGHIKDVDATDDEGNTALHLAAGYYNNEVFVRTLLHAKPNCTIQNSKGQTALHSAIEGGNDMTIIELLLQADCDPNVADFEGNTALHLCAIKRGIEPMIPGILLRFGANPNLKNEKGQTALHLASISGNKTVLLLLKFHAKVRVRDKEGNKASDLAATDEIRQILLWEEQQLEERTYRIEAIPPLEMLPQTRNSRNNSYAVFDGYNNDTKHLELCHGPRDSHHYWKSSGGDGYIHLPDDSHVVVPPQAVPHGTIIKLKISPTDECTDGEEPVFDFDKYNIELDVQLDLPGNPYKYTPTNDSHPSSIDDQSLAFTGMCIEGCNRWKSTRELKTSYDGTVGIHLNLNRTKTQPFVYKAPLEQRLSMLEVNLDSKNRNSDNQPQITSFTESPPNNEDELPSLSGEEEEIESYHSSESDHHNHNNEHFTNNLEMSSESSISDKEEDFYQREEEEGEERYYRHPIDSELATIHEETSLYSAPPDSGTYSDEEKENEYLRRKTPQDVPNSESGKGRNYDSRYYGDETSGDDVTMDDLDDLENFVEEKEASHNGLTLY